MSPIIEEMGSMSVLHRSAVILLVRCASGSSITSALKRWIHKPKSDRIWLGDKMSGLVPAIDGYVYPRHHVILIHEHAGTEILAHECAHLTVCAFAPDEHENETLSNLLASWILPELKIRISFVTPDTKISSPWGVLCLNTLGMSWCRKHLG